MYRRKIQQFLDLKNSRIFIPFMKLSHIDSMHSKCKWISIKNYIMYIISNSLWTYKYLYTVLLIIIKGNIIKFIRALLITNQSFGMTHYFSSLLIIFAASFIKSSQKRFSWFEFPVYQFISFYDEWAKFDKMGHS